MVWDRHRRRGPPPGGCRPPRQGRANPRPHLPFPSPAPNSKKTANGSKTSRKPGNPTSDPPQRGRPFLSGRRGHCAQTPPRPAARLRGSLKEHPAAWLFGSLASGLAASLPLPPQATASHQTPRLAGRSARSHLDRRPPVRKNLARRSTQTLARSIRIAHTRRPPRIPAHANPQISLTAPHVSSSGSRPRRSIPPTRPRLRLLRHPPAHRLSARLAALRPARAHLGRPPAADARRHRAPRPLVPRQGRMGPPPGEGRHRLRLLHRQRPLPRLRRQTTPRL